MAPLRPWWWLSPAVGSQRGVEAATWRVPEANQVVAVERADGTSEVTAAGRPRVVEPRPGAQTRAQVSSSVADRAAALRRPVGVLTRPADGESAVVAVPSGAV